MAVIRAPHPLAAGDLGVPLHAVTFVVVDLETTGGSPAEDRITEIGAVKVRGGEVLAERQTLVDPGRSIPLSVQRLTGITETMTSTHLPLEAVLPTFLEFARGACVVAHNARFDLGFLRAASSRLDYPAPPWPVVCTALLARRLVRDEVANLRLATLAQHFRCRTRPTHRALADARATVEVLHALLERAGTFGVVTLDDLVGFTKVRDAPLYKARRGLADALPHAPGVYAFLSASGEVLYVGKATDLRARVRSYFGGDERRRVAQMLREATAVEHAVCDSLLEAEVREVRLIAVHQPRYNRRSRHLRPAVHLKLTRERFPRLSIVAEPRDDGAAYLGPLRTRRAAEALANALYEVAPLRRCSARITRSGDGSRCVLAEIGRCPSPCDGSASEATYAPVATAIARAMAGDPSSALSRLGLRMDAFALDARFERAAGARDQLSALVTARARAERLAVLARVPVIVASRREGAAVTLARIKYGRLVSTARLGRGDESAAHVWRPLASAPDEDGMLLAALGPAGLPAPPVGGGWTPARRRRWSSWPAGSMPPACASSTSRVCSRPRSPAGRSSPSSGRGSAPPTGAPADRRPRSQPSGSGAGEHGRVRRAGVVDAGRRTSRLEGPGAGSTLDPRRASIVGMDGTEDQSDQFATDDVTRARAQAAQMYAVDTSAHALGITITDVAPGQATASMAVRPEMLNGHDMCHGGYVFLLADSAFAFACNTYGDAVVAAGCDIDFVRPARAGETLQAVAVERVRFGRSGVYDVTVRGEAGDVVAEMRGRSRALPNVGAAP